jgi:Tol biopolymer transport system component
MRRESVGYWTWFPAAVVIAAIGLAGCGGGGDGGVPPTPPGPPSPFTRVGGNNNSGDLGVALSLTGRYVAFSSLASDLVGTGNDTNSSHDIFIYDRQTADTTVASRINGTSGLKVANADAPSFFPAISTDGFKVAFESRANNLVGPADPANAFSDIFVHDRTLNTMARVSVAPGGAPTNGESNKPSISGDGRFVAFNSSATNLVLGDLNGVVTDVFLYDINVGTTTMVSGASGGAVFGHAVSDVGTRVAFESPPGGALKQIFVWTSPGPATAITAGNGDSRVSGISGNGQFVVFDSDASDLVPGDNNGVTDVFVRDLTAGTTTRVSVTDNGAQANGASFALGHKAISDNGAIIVFESDATNLGGTGSPAYYVRDRAAGTTTALAGVAATQNSTGVTISGDGLVAAFVTDDGSIVVGDTLGLFDVFIMAVP